MFSKKNNRRKRAFLIETNQRTRKKSKKVRNRFLSLLYRMLFIRQLLKCFKASFLLLLIPVSMGAFIIFAIFSPYFEIKKISIARDNPNINTKKIEASLQDWQGKNLLFLSQDKLKTSLFENFPEFKNVEIKEKWPAELNIKIEISPPVFTLLNQENANFSVLSEDGVILEEKPDKKYPIIKVLDYKPELLPGSRFLNKEIINKIKKSQELLTQEQKYTIKEIKLFPIAHEIHFQTTKETSIWIDLRGNIENQIKKLELAKLKIDFSKKNPQHIDLRIPNQIFWKP